MKTLLSSLAFLCGFAYLSANPSMVGMLGLMMVSMQSHRLTGRWPYPISRATRANLAFVSSLVDCLPYFALGLITMLLLEASGLPRFEFFRNTASKTQEMGLIPVAFIWSPVAIWLGVAGTPRTQKSMRAMAWNYRRVAHFFGAVILSVLTLGALTWTGNRSSVGVEVAAGIVMAAVVQGAFWLALRWHFSRKDLV